MAKSENPGGITLCLITSDMDVVSSVRASCPSPNVIKLFHNGGLVNEHHTISEYGERIVETSSASDVVVIDWSTEQAPAINTLCYQIRKHLVAPILAITRDGPETMTACLVGGVDDAVTLPVHLPYLQARILSYRRLIKTARTAQLQSGSPFDGGEPVPDMVLGDLRLSHRTHRFYVADVEIELTPREFTLFEYLLGRSDDLCTRDEILDAVWGINFDTGTNMVDVYMHYLRKKLESRGVKDVIETVRGLGYRLVHPKSTNGFNKPSK